MFQLPNETIFFNIEETIKCYRRYAQKQINTVVNNVTLDQAMVLIYISKFPDMSQGELAKMVFKDKASITRMIENLVKKGYLKRKINTKDRRQFHISSTQKGLKVVEKLTEVIQSNRQQAIQNIETGVLNQVKSTLSQITKNCNEK